MIALPSLTENKGFSCEPSRVKGYPMRETTENAEPDTRTDVDSSANILASADQILSSGNFEEREAERRRRLMTERLVDVVAEVPFREFSVPNFATITDGENSISVSLAKLPPDALNQLVGTWLERVYAKREIEMPWRLIGQARAKP